MRYSKEESTYILAVFSSGDTVTIDIWRLSDNAKVVDSASCSEVENTGIFKYEFSQTVTQKEEYLWIMNNGSYKKCGKIVLGGYMDHINSAISEHRNAVEPKVDATISSRLASDDSRLNNLDAPISSRSSHTPADVWTYPTRELTNPDNYKADISDLAKEATVQAIKSQTDKFRFNVDNDVIATLDGEVVNLTAETESQIDNIENNVTNTEQYKADISNLALQSTLEDVKLQTDKLQFDAQNNIIATLEDSLQNILSLILGLVQHNYRLFNTSYTTIGKLKKLTSATVRIYPTKEDCENNTNPLKTYSLHVDYDENGKVIDYKCVEV